MPIVTSRFGLLIDQIVALLQASPALADPVKVFDGPAPTDAEWKAAVFIGFDGNAAGTFEAATITQDWAYLGSTSQFEQILIHCGIVAWSGDVVPKTNRDKAIALLAGVETVLRAQPDGPTVGIDAGTITKVAVGAVYQEPYQGGEACRILFTIHAQTQLLTT